MTSETHRRTTAGDRWRQMQDAARGQAQRLGDREWTPTTDAYAGRIDSFRSGARTDHNLVEFLATAAGESASVLEVGAGAGRLSLPLARRVREAIALEPNSGMAETLEADARSAGIENLRTVRERWQDMPELTTDAVFAAHVVYAVPDIEDFVLRLQRSRSAGAP
jgi:cyclopropane fatty-acyl-phospholipid synthase-like methyltransferase